MNVAAMAALNLLKATMESHDMHLLRHVRTLILIISISVSAICAYQVVRFLTMLTSCNEEERKDYAVQEGANLPGTPTNLLYVS